MCRIYTKTQTNNLINKKCKTTISLVYFLSIYRIRWSLCSKKAFFKQKPVHIENSSVKHKLVNEPINNMFWFE